jgi:N-acyl-L-homoserine lactone synthetase
MKGEDMILIIDANNIEKYAGYLEEHHKHRFDIYIKKHKWYELKNTVRPDLEIDQYDNARLCTYLVCLSEECEVKGAVRLTPTLYNTLTTEYFSHLISGEVPNSSDVWEISRFFVVDRSWIGRKGPAERELAIGMLEFAIENNINKLTGIYHPTLLQRVALMPWEIEYIGMPESDEEPYIPANILIDQNILEKTKAISGFRGKMLEADYSKIIEKPSNFRAEDIYSKSIDDRLSQRPDITIEEHHKNLADIHKRFGASTIH